MQAGTRFLWFDLHVLVKPACVVCSSHAQLQHGGAFLTAAAVVVMVLQSQLTPSCALLPLLPPPPPCCCQSKQVVAAAMARGGEAELQELVRRFRQVFVVACQPKYLPANWAVDAKDSREFGEYSVYAQAEAARLPAAGVAAAAAAEDGVGAAAGGTAGVGAEQVQGDGVKKNGSNGGQEATGVEAESFGAECLSIFGHKTAPGC